MAAYDGEFCSNVERPPSEGKAGYTRLATGELFHMDPAPGPAGPIEHFKMRGFRFDHAPPDFEYWITDNFPDTNNPSGEPITDVAVVDTWRS